MRGAHSRNFFALQECAEISVNQVCHFLPIRANGSGVNTEVSAKSLFNIGLSLSSLLRIPLQQHSPVVLKAKLAGIVMDFLLLTRRDGNQCLPSF